MKRIISFILTFCMLMSLTAAFAENDNEIENNENIIDTSLLTDENVLYKAIQEKNGFSLFGLGDRDNDEIIADFDVVMGFDMSYSMYEYDINGDKQWIDSFKSISEQAPEDTRYAVLSSNSEGFTDDLDKAISEVQEKEYTGTNDIISILDRTISVFDEESSNRNKVVLVTTHKVDDISALKDKMDELSDYGIIPFVFVLNTDTNNALNMDGIYQCPTDLDLRLSISDLYLAFCEFNMTEAAQTYANTIDYNVYRVLSDFRTDRHMFVGADNNAGLQMASMLNMYKCVPLKASIGTKNQSEYDLLNTSSYSGNNIDLKDKLQSFVSGENAKFGEVPYDFQYVWNSIFGQISNNRKIIISNPDITQAATVLRKNMKRRFPMMMKHDDEWEIVYEYRNPIGGSLVRYNENKEIEFNKIQAVFDTYEYLMSTVGKATNLYDTLDWQSSQVTIDTIYPENYSIKINGEYNQSTIKRSPLIEEDNNEEYDEEKNPSISYVANGQTLHTTVKRNRNFVIASLTTFMDGYPDIYGSNKVYRIKLFTDIKNKEWYTDYVFAAMNKEIISGYTDRTFRPNREVSRGELIIMMLKALCIVPEEKYNTLSDVISQEKKGLLKEKLSTLSVNDINKLKLTGNGISINNIDTLMGVGDNAYWGKLYMNYALANDLITVDEYLGMDYKDKTVSSYDEVESFMGANIKLTREEAARMIWDTLYIHRKQSNVPTLLYEYPAISESYKYMAFSNYGIDVNTDKGHAIYQLYMNGIMNGHDEENMGEKDLLTRAQVSVLLIKSLFDLNENIPVIEANIEGIVSSPEPSAVPIIMDTTKKIIDDVVFNIDNTISYDITISDEHKYLIETTGALVSSNLCSQIMCISGNGQISHKKGSSDITNPQREHIWYVIEGVGTYHLKILREGTDDINIEITDMEKTPNLEFTPKAGGKYVYSNNRESISLEDLADSNNPNGPQLLFQQDRLKTGTYTIMIEHRNTIQNKDIYLDMQFYDPNHNSKITITKYGDDLFGTGHEANGQAKSWSCMKGYAEFFGESLGRVRQQSPDVDGDAETPIISISPGLSNKIVTPNYTFREESSIWLSQLYKTNDYPSLTTEEGMYIMMEIEVESQDGIQISIAAFEAVEPYSSRLSKYLPTDSAPYYYDDSFKGIAQFKPETEADLELFIDDEKIANSTNNAVTQPITITNPFATNGIEVWWWHTHMNPQVERWNANHNVESDILPLYYFDSTQNKTFIFDTKHKADYDNDDLRPAELTKDDFGSNNIDIACNLGNFGVKTTYKISVTNTGDSDRIFVYKINTISNMFLAVRNEYGEYLDFYVDGQYVKAICSGQATDKGQLYPIISDESTVKVLLPTDGQEKIYNEEGELKNPDSETELQIKLPANSRLTFYVDEVLPTGNPGSITTSILFR